MLEIIIIMRTTQHWKTRNGLQIGCMCHCDPPRAASGVCLKLQQAPGFQIQSLMLCCSIEHFFFSCQLFFFYSQCKLEQQSQVNICSGPAWISTCFDGVYIKCIRIIRRTRWHSQLFWWPPGTSPLTPGFEFQLEMTQIIVEVTNLSSWNSDSPSRCGCESE